jgi:hypothetical protein
MYENQIKGHFMVTFEELKKISDKPLIERSFYAKLEEAKQIALTTNKRSIELKVMKLSFFTDQLAVLIKEPFDADEMYKSQYEQVKMFKDAGFTVTEEDPAPAIITSISESSKDKLQREFDSQYLEKKVTVSW